MVRRFELAAMHLKTARAEANKAVDLLELFGSSEVGRAATEQGQKWLLRSLLYSRGERVSTHRIDVGNWSQGRKKSRNKL
jgi:hypothetical protein